MSARRKILVVFGTRPEAIKLAPLIAELRSRRELFDVHLCSTGQHRDLLVEPLAAFGLVPDTNLEVMRAGQSLASLLSRILAELGPVFEAQRPDICVVQGDTSSAFGGAVAAFYAQVPIAHVEAGLRSGDRSSPFPEEEHRILIDSMARWCFAPTEEARNNLLRESVDSERIWLTGNTGIDALRWLERRSRDHDSELDAYLEDHGVGPEDTLLVATIHRREHPDEELADIAKALAEIAARPNIRVIAPTHPNPQVRATLDRCLHGSAVRRVPVLDPVRFCGLLRRAAVVVTDSGGVQEEATSLGVPSVIVRRRSDRPESVYAGLSRVVGCDRAAIVHATFALLDSPQVRRPCDVFGDGRACARIADVLGLDASLG